MSQAKQKSLTPGKKFYYRYVSKKTKTKSSPFIYKGLGPKKNHVVFGVRLPVFVTVETHGRVLAEN